LDRMAALDRADRRNGSYRRQLLTELGDIELAVPRTRRFAPIAVVRAYARSGPDIRLGLFDHPPKTLAEPEVSRLYVRGVFDERRRHGFHLCSTRPMLEILPLSWQVDSRAP